MASNDSVLGFQIHEQLKTLGIENPIIWDAPTDRTMILAGTRRLCDGLAMNLSDPSTIDTPRRLADMYADELCWGLDYNNFPKCLVTPNDGKFDEIVLVKNITLKSLCEHHFMPVLGRCHIAYIPADHILGLSKFNRIVDFFARRPHLQERLGQQIAATLKMILKTEDVAVIIEAEHFCVKFRGIQDECSSTSTSCMSGKFRTEASARAELLALIGHGG